MTPDELALGRERIKRWERIERVALTKLTEPEATLIVEATAVLDLTPAPGIVFAANAIDIDLRGDA